MASRHFAVGLLALAAAFAAPARELPQGSGPRLGRLAPGDAAGRRLSEDATKAGPTYVDLPCNVFLPGKADPNQWMATGTWARLLQPDFSYVYGYDPLSQSYDMLVSGFADQNGFLLQESVGVAVAQLSGPLSPTNVLSVELWLTVNASNLFPFEFVGITQLSGLVTPNSNLDNIDAWRLYDDARGFTGAAYFVDHLPVGAHAIELGPQAAADMKARAGGAGWFGVGFAADGWDLSGSLGEMVFWRLQGGGALPVEGRPFFRVHYNAPPGVFQLSTPAQDERTDAHPTLSWSAANDPNGDAPIHYQVRLGQSPGLEQAVEWSTGTARSTQPPFALLDGHYWWQVVASDPLGEARASAVRSFEVDAITAAPSHPAGSNGLSAWPNPFNPRVRLRASVAQTGAARLWIADLRGRAVRTLFDGRLEAGTTDFHWDATAQDGERVASGLYLVVLDHAGGRAVRRVALAQ